jgi:tetratricopeptide (TPR) repeat protein
MGIEGNHSPEVEQILRQAVQIGRTNPIPKANFVTALSRLGQYLRYENRIDEAEPLLNEALPLSSAQPTFSANLALEQLGAIRVKRGDLDGGERYYRQRRDLLMRLGGPTNGTAMDSRSRWAALLARRGRVQEALQEMRQNMVYCRRAFAAGSLGLWHPLSTLAYILNLAGQPTEALALSRESLACLGPTNRSDPRLAQIELEAGVSLAKLHRNREAIPYLEDSYRIASADPGFGPTDYRVLRAKEYLNASRANAGR